MPWGIIVYQSFGRFHPFTMADDLIYDGFKQDCHKYGMNFLIGKKGISDQEIDNLSDKVCDIVKRKNDGESLNLKKELESIL